MFPLLRIFPSILFFIAFSVFFPFPVCAGQPQVKIVSPTDNQIIVGNTVTVSFILGNIQFGKEGHAHLWLDTPPEASRATELLSHLDHIIEGMPQGTHTLTIEAVKPDHSSFTPRILSASRFMLQHPVEIPPSSPAASLPAPEKEPFSLFQIIGIGIAIVAILAGFVLFFFHRTTP